MLYLNDEIRKLKPVSWQAFNATYILPEIYYATSIKDFLDSKDQLPEKIPWKMSRLLYPDPLMAMKSRGIYLNNVTFRKRHTEEEVIQSFKTLGRDLKQFEEGLEKGHETEENHKALTTGLSQSAREFQEIQQNGELSDMTSSMPIIYNL